MRTLDELLFRKATVNCRQCQGMSLHGRPGELGYCSACKGRAYVDITAYALLTDAQRVEALETELLRLRPELASRRVDD